MTSQRRHAFPGEKICPAGRDLYKNGFSQRGAIQEARMSLHHFMFFLHMLGVIVWMGGSVFLYLCFQWVTRQLPPAVGLTLWAAVLARFFPLVWASIAIILLSGFWIFFERGYQTAPMAWRAMVTTGFIMIIVYALQWFGPWSRLYAAVRREDWASAAVQLNVVLRWIGFNLGLGMVTVAVATIGLGL